MKICRSMDPQAIRIKIDEHIAEPMNTQVRQKVGVDNKAVPLR